MLRGFTVYQLLTLLSHHLRISTPGFAGGDSLKIDPIKEIASGGSSNNYRISLPCHLGTHIDAPRHFSDAGRPISSFSVEDLVFTKPLLVELPLGSGALVGRHDLESFEPEVSEIDILLIRTWFQRYRDTDAAMYSSKNPGVSLEAARYLSGLSQLRAVGFDFISLSSVMHREEGRSAHRALLTARDFFILEDMDLAHYPPDTRRVIVAPLFVEGVDSAPCTVIAEN